MSASDELSSATDDDRPARRADAEVAPDATRVRPFATPDDAQAPPPSLPGPRKEQVVIVLQLLGDLVSVPFHLVAFLFTRSRVRRAFRHALDESAR
ncbi:MAG: hypothetical protein H6825_13095 [Planctomycetes bacterium]|nr:hypothetical protein [Planctomycetota bacterium]